MITVHDYRWCDCVNCEYRQELDYYRGTLHSRSYYLTRSIVRAIFWLSAGLLGLAALSFTLAVI